MKLRFVLLAAATVLAGMPASAQDANIDGRVKKLEKEMRAVQRKVFPGGAGRFFEPEIKAEDKVQGNKAPTTTAVTDLIARVDALEAQLASLTGQVEEQGNKQRSMEARLKAIEEKLKEPAVPAIASSQPAAPSSAAAEAVPASASSERVNAVAAIERPSSDDAGEDAYIYGYRLWAAKYYPEAQKQLNAAAEKYPKHRRASFARNLEGRSYLDEGKPATAAKIFYDNYKTDPRGQRAPDSLYFLGVALTELKKNKEACEAFGQLESAYPGEAEGRLADRLSRGRSKASCS